jgi:zinc protease
MKIVTLPLADDPIVSIRLVFNAGSMNDPQDRNGLASLTASLLAEGATKMNGYDAILKKLYPLAASYAIQCDREYTTFFGQCHRDNLDKFYQLFKEAILEPAFNNDDFNRLKMQQLNFIKNSLRYSSDEELGKAVFKSFVYKGTAYEKNIFGKVADIEKIALDDVKNFYQNNFTSERLIVGLSGNYPEQFPVKLQADFQTLSRHHDQTRIEVTPQAPQGLQFLLVEKKTESTGIHIGFPISVLRGQKDFYALFLFNSWFGEHRNSSSHLYQVIREKRGFNYGDYSYIEDFPQGGWRTFPPTNVYKKPQLFEIWIRPVSNENRLFVLRAALRELHAAIANGLTKDQFELTKKFLAKYNLHYAASSMERLGYKIDDMIFGIKDNYLDNFKKNIEKLTLEQVNNAIKKYLQDSNLKIVIITQDAAKLQEQLLANSPSPITYQSAKPDEIIKEDKLIEIFPLKVKKENIAIIPVEKIFE